MADKEGKTTGGKAFEGLTGNLATGLSEVYKGGMPVFGQDLNAGMGDQTRTALEELFKGSYAPNNLDEATSFGNTMLRGGGLTTGQRINSAEVGGLGNAYQSMADRLSGRSAAQGGYDSLGQTFGNISKGLAGRSQADLGYDQLGDAFGGMARGLAGRSQADIGFDRIADSTRGPSSAQTGFEGIGRSLAGPSDAETDYGRLSGQYGDVAAGLRGKSTAESLLGRIAGGANAYSLTETELGNTARGDYLGGSNPYLKDVLNNAAEDTTADFGAAFGSAGRFGGSGHAGSLSKSLADTRTSALNQNYETERDRQVQALGAIEGQRQQGKDNEYRAITGADSARLAQLGARLGAMDREGSTIGAADAARRGNLSDRMGALSAGDTARLNQAGLNMSALSAQDKARLDQLGARTGLMDRQGTALGAQDAARRGQLADRLGALDRQGTALGASDSARLAQINARTGLLDRALGAAKDQFGFEQQGVTNRFGASDRAAGLADASLDAARTRLGVGQVQDANSQAELEAQNDLFRRKNDSPYNNIARILGLATGGGGLGDQAGVKQQTPWWQTLAGLGIAGIGALG